MRMRSRWTQAAAIAAVALSSQLPAALAQSAGQYAQTCRTIRGRVVCSYPARSSSVAGTHAYDRWSDGSPALGGSGSPDAYRFPQYLGGHNAWYGLGR